MVKVDATYSGETRPRSLAISGPPGLSFTDEGTGKVLFTVPAKPFLAACLEVSAASGQWAKKLHAALLNSSGE